MKRKEWAENFYGEYFTNLNPNRIGECSVICPWHDDNTESMSINLNTGRFYCHACGIGGDEYEFYRRIEERDKSDFVNYVSKLVRKFGPRPLSDEEEDFEPDSKAEELPPEPETEDFIPEREIIKFHRMLLNSNKTMHFLLNKRGLKRETIEKYRLGYDVERITIPIFDSSGRCVNIRRYLSDAKGKAKMVSYSPGMGAARLYPISNVEHDEILLVEGEMDCLLANQLGYNAITTTGGANTWKARWNSLFKNKKVNIVYDIDKAGLSGAEKVAENIKYYAKEIKIVRLPIVDPPDADLTDFFVSLGHTKEDLDKVISKTKTWESLMDSKREKDKNEPVEVHLSQASEAEFLNRKIQMEVIVAGKDTGPFAYPKKIKISCNADNGAKCATCGIGISGGQRIITFKDDDRSVLELINCSDAQQKGVIKRRAMIPSSCNAFNYELIEKENLEEVILQPELDFSSQTRPYTTRVSYVIGHGIEANRSYRMKGITITDPRRQYVTHLISDTEPSQDSIKSFAINKRKMETLRIFQPKEGQTIKDKFDEIHEDLVNNVTRIYGRKDVMTAVDLVYHSVLSFDFQGQRLQKGWVETLIIGDTRTGKSETAHSMMNHYKAGEFITGENTSFAGLIGGMQQTQKRWFVSWGKIPLNDRRLVIIDEASGLTESSIANMSGVRSSGVAEVTKIHQERTHARTRLIWISNTRTGKPLRQYGFGVEAVIELMGKNEDVSRFEFVVSCASEEVSMDVINRKVEEVGIIPHKYTYDICKQLVLWAWSRSPEDIIFTDDAVDAILISARQMAKDFVSEVPLVEGANQRIKIARMAVATACRVFNSPDGVKVVVEKEHVEFVHNYLYEVYGKQSLGYKDLSDQVREQESIAEKAKDKVEEFLSQNPEVARLFLRYSYVNGRDLEDMCDLDSSTVRSYLKFLAKNGMIGKNSRGYSKQPAFITILRKGEWKNEEDDGSNVDFDELLDGYYSK